MPKTVTKRIAREYPQFPEGTVLTEEFIETLVPEDRRLLTRSTGAQNSKCSQ